MKIKQKTNTTWKVLDRLHKGILRYANINNRNIAIKILKDNNVGFKLSISSNQQIHPEYIEDWEGEIETGFGNSMYQTFFKRLYNIEIL